MAITDQNNENHLFALRPDLPKDTHPVYSKSYLLATNEIARMYDTVCNWIRNHSPGGIIYGRQRIGKTQAIKYLINFLPHEFGEDLPTFLYLSQRTVIPNELAFFNDMLRGLGHPLWDSGPKKTLFKRDKLYKFLIQKGQASSAKRIILIIDDAQRLMELHYEWLMDIYNELDRVGIDLTAILVGQVELKFTRDDFLTEGKMQIVGRFMSHEYVFTGITCKEDLHQCLLGYDEYATYPVNDPWPFTRYFFPNLYDNGFRLSSMTSDIWEIYHNLYRENNIQKAIEVPMVYFTLAINYLLTRYGIDGENADMVTKNMLRKAIEFSGFIEAEKHINGIS
ncbi:ATP-binding protein [Bacillus sp. AFS088145]|uniref:ATP-binding protein n=1 Tax=Bacillus sp. AFS088145 TaxID=2033514 RepID=UPI000BFA52B8|nr:ATP-binding protein [Bacillus sp. AFS088145]PFH91405.1 AAA family ATPase [Bacillus sp. AFS088145]